MSHIFISYSREDSTFVDQLVEALRGESIDVWLDRETKRGQKWDDEISEKLLQSIAVIVVVSVNSNIAEWVKDEIAFARKHQKPIFPLLLSGELPLSLNRIVCEAVQDRRLPSEHFYNDLRQLNQTQAVHKEHLPVPKSRSYTDAHKLADMKLFRSLWQDLNAIGGFVQDALFLIVEEEHMEHVFRYMSRRNQVQNAFISEEFEAAFEAFDTALADFRRLMANWFSLEEFGESYVYKLNEKILMIRGVLSSEEYFETLKKHDEKIDTMQDKTSEIFKLYSQIVKLVKYTFPESDL